MLASSLVFLALYFLEKASKMQKMSVLASNSLQIDPCCRLSFINSIVESYKRHPEVFHLATQFQLRQ